MQPRLALTRFPSTVFALVFALIAALVLGGVAGYTLSPTKVTPGPTHVVLMPAGSSGPDTQCVFVNHQKAC